MKRVVAIFTVDDDYGDSWNKQDIALKLETCTTGDDFTNAIVWDSLDDFLADYHDGLVEGRTA